jgi:hypothetical protein
VIHEIFIQDVQGNWTRVKALIDCGATSLSIFASPRLIEILGLGTQQAHTTIYGLDGNIRSHVKDSRKTRLSVSYFEHKQPVDESDVLIVPMTAYDLVLGLPWFKTAKELPWFKTRKELPWFKTAKELPWFKTRKELPWFKTAKELPWFKTRKELPWFKTAKELPWFKTAKELPWFKTAKELPWFKTRNPEIDWEAGRLLSLQRRQPQPNRHGKEVSPTETGPDIQTLSATAFEDLCSSDEVSDTFTLGECIGLLGATTEGPSRHDELQIHTPGADKAGRSSGSSCGRRAQARLE